MSAVMSPEHLVMEALAACARRGIPVQLDHISASLHAAELMLRSFGLVPNEAPAPAELVAAPSPDATLTMPAIRHLRSAPSPVPSFSRGSARVP